MRNSPGLRWVVGSKFDRHEVEVWSRSTEDGLGSGRKEEKGRGGGCLSVFFFSRPREKEKKETKVAIPGNERGRVVVIVLAFSWKERPFNLAGAGIMQTFVPSRLEETAARNGLPHIKDLSLWYYRH